MDAGALGRGASWRCGIVDVDHHAAFEAQSLKRLAIPPHRGIVGAAFDASSYSHAGTETTRLARSSYCERLNSSHPPPGRGLRRAASVGGDATGDCARTVTVVALPAASTTEVSAWRRVTRCGLGMGLASGKT